MELRLLDAELRSDEVIRLLVAARERVPEGVRPRARWRDWIE